MSKLWLRILGIGVMGLFISCIPNEFDSLELDCGRLNYDLWPTSWKELNDGAIIQIKDSITIEAYVISSQAQGQFYAEVILQDQAKNPSQGLRILTDFSFSDHLIPPGTRIGFDVSYLLLQKKHGVLTLGTEFSSFGNIAIGRIPINTFKDRLLFLCDPEPLEPIQLVVEKLPTESPMVLVELDSLQFKNPLTDLTFSEDEEETFRTLINCRGDSLMIKTSNYAKFAKDTLPNSMGSLVGVLRRDNYRSFLELRSKEDLQFNQEPCVISPSFETSNEILITEWADPYNESKARFIELFNASDHDISLKGWQLIRYTNSNTSPSGIIDFDQEMIPSNSTFVVGLDSQVFMSIYGVEANRYASSSTVVGSNGDDTAVLIDPFGNVIDIFGVIGEDGTGTTHDFEDGKALRKSAVQEGSSEFIPEQWEVYNKRGESGTIKQLLRAPEDFSPGIR